MPEKTLAEQVETVHEPANELRDMIEAATRAADDGAAVEGDPVETGAGETGAAEPDAGAEDRETDAVETDAVGIDAVETEPGETGEDDAVVTDEAGAEALEPPAHWSLDDQTMFRAQAPEAQKWLLDRSKAMDAAHTKRSQEIAPLRTVMDKWSGYLDQLGATPEQAFDMLIAAEYQLRTGTPAQKHAALAQLAQDYGIQAAPAAQPNGQDGDDGDYLATDIRKAVAPIAEQVNQLRAGFQHQATASAQTAAAQVADDIRHFTEAKTEAGTPAHPYFAEVEADMTRLAQADRAAGLTPTLADLYERAIWSNPTVRAKMLAAQQHAASRQTERERKERIRRAKRASATVTGQGSAPKEQPKSLRDEIEAQWDVSAPG